MSSKFYVVVQLLSLLLTTMLVYAGGLIEASTYNSNCAPLPGQPLTWERPMPPQVPGFSAADVLTGMALLLPCLVLVHKRRRRVFIAATFVLLVLVSADFFASAFGPIGCANSGGQTDDYDYPGFFVILVYALVLVADYAVVLSYGLSLLLAGLGRAIKRARRAKDRL